MVLSHLPLLAGSDLDMRCRPTLYSRACIKDILTANWPVWQVFHPKDLTIESSRLKSNRAPRWI